MAFHQSTIRLFDQFNQNQYNAFIRWKKMKILHSGFVSDNKQVKRVDEIPSKAQTTTPKLSKNQLAVIRYWLLVKCLKGMLSIFIFHTPELFRMIR